VPRLITVPKKIPVPGDKLIEEWVGIANTGTSSVSVARMVAPPGWAEPFQTPEFDEVTIVLRGTLRVDHEGGSTDVSKGEVVLVSAGERIRYGNPHQEECEYFAVCAPAFRIETVNREE
jgi:mannose-6-phosphate isomerase-like protein (cupin superfamily)